MRPSPLLISLLSVLVLAGCNDRDSTGMMVTRDGRLTAETAEVSRDEFAFRMAQRAQDAAGTGWKATVAIQEMPKRDQVKADEWGWSTMTVTLTLFPPTGIAGETETTAKAEAAIREAAIYRVNRPSDVVFVTTVAASGAPLPGSQRYTSVAGDTYAGISTAFYGSPQHWRRIADANPAVDGAQLAPGTLLSIPPKP